MPYNINLQICFKFFKLSFSEDLDQEGIETYLGLPREKFQSENLCEKWDKRIYVEVTLSRYSPKEYERICMYSSPVYDLASLVASLKD